MPVSIGVLLAGVLIGLVAAALSGGAAAQFDQLNWTLQQHGPGTPTLTPELMKMFGGNGGASIAYTSHAPDTLHVFVDMYFNAWDSATGSAFPLLVVGPIVTQLAINTESKPLSFDVPGGAEFGFGMLQVQPTMPGIAEYTTFTLTPVPQTVPGEAADDAFGAALATIGDVNGDGVPDVVGGMPRHDAGGTNAGGALVLSGADGSILLQLLGASAGDQFGAALGSSGDVNGDGTPDVIVGAPHSSAGGPNSGQARVHSGVDGSVLWTFVGSAGAELGSGVSGAGDVDGDGLADLIVGAPHDGVAGTNAGAAFVFAGADGALLHTFPGGAPGALAGASVVSLGDVNSDGMADVAVGAPMGAAGFGEVRVYSGGDGFLLYSLVGTAPSGGKFFGICVTSIGDLDGDAVRELAVGEPKANHGKVHVYSGATGTELLLLDPGFFTWEMGAAIADGGDVNGDGFDDIVAGAPELALPNNYKMGRVLVFSGRDGSILWRLSGATNHDAYGSAVAGLGDRDGDGLAEIVVGVPGLDAAGTDAGSVVFQDFFVSWFDLGQGIPGTHGLPDLAGAGLLFAGTPLTVKLTNAIEMASATLVVGFSELGAPLKGGVLVPEPDVVISGLPTGATGGFTLSATWPGGVPPGLELFAQAWIPDLLAIHGVAASNALRIEVP
jgi:hypothetical protein